MGNFPHSPLKGMSADLNIVLIENLNKKSQQNPIIRHNNNYIITLFSFFNVYNL